MAKSSNNNKHLLTYSLLLAFSLTDATKDKVEAFVKEIKKITISPRLKVTS